MSVVVSLTDPLKLVAPELVSARVPTPLTLEPVTPLVPVFAERLNPPPLTAPRIMAALTAEVSRVVAAPRFTVPSARVPPEVIVPEVVTEEGAVAVAPPVIVTPVKDKVPVLP
jgi:hypothetical protein